MKFLQEFQQRPLYKRQEEARKLLCTYPNRVPIFIDKAKVEDPDIDKHKFLAPGDLPFSDFIGIIRGRLKLSPSGALYFFTNNALVPISQLLSQVYAKYKDEDEFLYIVYAQENTFGAQQRTQ